ncbi:alpha-N-acetylgalactosaminide alpha-2,6-sialyltransferase 2-like [Amphiura filiformis]|uniref:alpha-N-acetylgalactosaminide alpha-2,6-sialyltransferase 2-like n=1 Tax=Amphiura filiformis TaxID=82378 RepID=UPI003B213538
MGTNAGLKDTSKSKQRNNYADYAHKTKNETRADSKDTKIAHVNTTKSTDKGVKKVIMKRKRVRDSIKQLRMLKYKRGSNETRRQLPMANERFGTENVYKRDLQDLNYKRGSNEKWRPLPMADVRFGTKNVYERDLQDLKYKRGSNEKRMPLPMADGRFGTENVYKRDLQYLQYMKCPTTLRHKMSNRTALKGKYIKDVPILLTREHVTESEYNRLKIFRDLMGWKGSKFEDILKTMDLLKTSGNQYLFDDRLVNGKVVNGNCIRCAVVGNGGILNGSRMGREIDSHDYVFRTNVAITKGHEDDVGNKTSFYCFGMKTLSTAIASMKNKGFSAPPWNPNIRYIFLPEDDWAYRYIYAALTHSILPKGNKEKYAKREPFVFPKPLVPEEIKIIHPDFCRYIDNSWLKSLKLRRVGRATTGAIMLFLALHTCDEVSAFGFMGDPNKFTYHYYDQNFTNSDGLTRAFWHDWDKENDLWKLLIKEGIFHMYTRN